MEATKFNAADLDPAFDEWGCNCGPGAIAAVLDLPVAEVRPHLGEFEARRYVSPPGMIRSLNSLGVRFVWAGGANLGQDAWPTYGLARIQWEGRWTNPGVPARAAYRHTHWVGVNARNPDNIGIFDVNARGNGSGWCSLADWTTTIVPAILKECVPKASGGWHITHVIEVAGRKCGHAA